MPQMAPMSWMMLFLIFSITFTLFKILNFFSFSHSSHLMLKKNKSSMKKKINWKW